MIVASVFYGEISSIGPCKGLSRIRAIKFGTFVENGEKLDYCHHKLDLLQQPSFNNLHGSFVAIFPLTDSVHSTLHLPADVILHQLFLHRQVVRSTN
jgi:hypothetical protein